jgi:hypothetical protein
VNLHERDVVPLEQSPRNARADYLKPLRRLAHSYQHTPHDTLKIVPCQSIIYPYSLAKTIPHGIIKSSKTEVAKWFARR